MKELMKAYENYRFNGGNITSFNEFLTQLAHNAYLLDEQNVAIEAYSDDIRTEGYYDALCEAIEVTLKTKDPKERKISKETIERYKIYKKKQKAKGEEVLGLEEWVEKQRTAAELKKDAAKAGIKILGAVGSTIALSKVIKNKKLTVERKNGNKYTYETGSTKTATFGSGKTKTKNKVKKIKK